MNEIVFLSFARTPIGSFQGALAGVTATKLGATAIRGCLSHGALAPSQISDVYLGNVLQAGLGQAPARQAALGAGLPPTTRCVTINKVCGSALEAVLAAARAIRVGDAHIAIAGGMESMSRAPYILPHARAGYRMGHQQSLDSLLLDGLWCSYGDTHMGNHAETCAGQYGFTREQQDEYAIASFQRAQAAQAEGAFADEIEPVQLTDGRDGITTIYHDEGPAKVRYEKIPTLRPAFQKNGTITAANASTLNDGAAALALTSQKEAERYGLRPVARLISSATSAQEPNLFATAPVQAARDALATAGWSVGDVDLWEVNEAFAVVPLAFMHELGVPHDKVNVHGGAIALGHPIGASGARILITLISALQRKGLKRGVAAICIGGGEGIALCIELP